MRSVFLLCAVVGLGIIMAFPQTSAPKSLSPFEQELLNNEKQFLQALQERNVAYVSQIVSGDFNGIATNGDLYDKEEQVASAHDGLPKDFRFYDVRVVRLDDGCAVVAYNTIIPGGHPHYRHVSDTWAKAGGQWKLKFEQTTPNLWSALDLD